MYEKRGKELNDYLSPHTPEELAILESDLEKAGQIDIANAVNWYRKMGFIYRPYFGPIEQAVRGPLNKLPTLMHLDEPNQIVAKWRFALGK